MVKTAEALFLPRSGWIAFRVQGFLGPAVLHLGFKASLGFRVPTDRQEALSARPLLTGQYHKTYEQTKQGTLVKTPCIKPSSPFIAIPYKPCIIPL